MDSKHVVLISLIALTLIAAVAGLFSSAYLIQRVAVLESKVDYLYQETVSSTAAAVAPTPDNGRLAGKVLATSPDGTFNVYGFGACIGTFRVENGATSTLFTGKNYVFHRHITLEEADLGAVAVQTSADYASKPAYPSIAFRTDSQVVSYTLIEYPENDCMVGISQP